MPRQAPSDHQNRHAGAPLPSSPPLCVACCKLQRSEKWSKCTETVINHRAGGVAGDLKELSSSCGGPIARPASHGGREDVTGEEAPG